MRIYRTIESWQARDGKGITQGEFPSFQEALDYCFSLWKSNKRLYAPPCRNDWERASTWLIKILYVNCQECHIIKNGSLRPLCGCCAKKGERNPQYGKPVPQHLREATSKRHKGIPKPQTEQHRRKLSEAHKGKKRLPTPNVLKGRKYPTKKELLQWYVIEGLTFNEIAEKTGWSWAFIQQHIIKEGIPVRREVTSETRLRISQSNRGRTVPLEVRKATSENSKRLWQEPAYRKKQQEVADRKNRNIKAALNRKDVREKRSKRIAEKWKDPEYVKSQRDGRSIVPNKLETDFGILCKSYGLENIRFVGDWNFAVSGKCPDFFDGKSKVIELYGDYWHRGDDPVERINFFQSHGYDCLVLWENEVRKTPEKAMEKVLSFLGKSKETAHAELQT